MRRSVVAFIVTVRLIENTVNSHVGSVIVVNVINQYKKAGIELIGSMRSCKPEMDCDEAPGPFKIAGGAQLPTGAVAWLKTGVSEDGVTPEASAREATEDKDWKSMVDL